MEDFCEDVRVHLRDELDEPYLHRLAEHLHLQFQKKLQESDICMLPSYSHRFPTGNETGLFLDLDVGGSTLRIALVELRGSPGGDVRTNIKMQQEFPMDDAIKNLRGTAFFHWIASCVHNIFFNKDMLQDLHIEMLPLGLSWSFPVEYERFSFYNSPSADTN